MKTPVRALLLFILLTFAVAAPALAQTTGTPPPPTPAPTATRTLSEEFAVSGFSEAWRINFIQNYGLASAWIGFALLAGLIWFASRVLAGAGKVIERQTEKAFTPEVKPADKFAEITRTYMERFAAHYSRFSFRGLEDVSGGKVPPFNKAYVSLRLSPLERERTKISQGQREAMGDFWREGGAAEVTLTEAVKRASRLAIVGAAGSGKSTLLQWAGVTAARAQLPGPLTPEQKAFIEVVGQPLPVFISLRDFVKYCRAEASRAISPSALMDFCLYSYREQFSSIEFPADFFERHLKSACLLLLDGVDEVAPEDRVAVRSAVEGLVTNYGVTHVRYLLSSRAVAYKGQVEFADFERLDVQPLSTAQRDELARFWCEAIYLPEEASRNALELSQSINRSDERVRNLARTPLMVAIFVLVYYHNQRKLPNQRAEFYHRAARVLVSETHHDKTADYADWENLSLETRIDHLKRIAWELYTRDLNEATAEELLEWTAGEFPKGAAEALVFFTAAANRSGLLEERGGQYGFFTHKTFHEYLTGLYLAQDLEDHWAAELSQHLLDDNWLEVTRLAAGALAYLNRIKAEKFIQLLSNLGATPEERNAALERAALAQADFPADRAQAHRETLAQRCEQGLINVDLPAKTRRALGLALAALGDPRFPPLPAGEGAGGEGERRAISPTWCPIPAGPARLGTTPDDIEQLKQFNIDWNASSWFKNEQPAHTVTLSPYWLGKHPITNAEFARFLAAKGYEHPKYWGQDGWRWRQGQYKADLSVYEKDLRKSIEDWLRGRPVEERHQPFFWEDPQWNAANLPVVGVTWFEAEAYCCWLTEQLKDQLPAGWRVRLPTEAEWEKAARRSPSPSGGGLGWGLWPWGNEWDSERCNMEESQLNATTPVGMYPRGASFDGVEDLIGNVWEWCWDGWDIKAYQDRDGQTDPLTRHNNTRVLRGGAFDDNRRICRAAFRYRDIPYLFSQNFGFRVCASPILHAEL